MEKIGPADFGSYVLHLTEEALNPTNIVTRKCFLCGGDPTRGNGEHIIPTWLQRRFDLWDSKLGLLNGSLLHYRNLRVPACTHCNGLVLGKTESYVSKLSGNDIDNWSLAHSYEVGRWMAKILVGILFKESSLPHNRQNPSLGSIYPPEEMDEVRLLHLLIQSWRKIISFKCIHAKHPFTLYVYSIDQLEGYSNFNLSTNIYGKSICLRFGDLGFAFVGDGGLQQEMAELGPFDLCFRRLHPIQFDEIAARIHYKSALRDATHSYVFSEEADVIRFEQVAVLPYTRTILPDGSNPVFKYWSGKDLAEVFKRYRVPGFEHLIDANGEASFTRLVDESGKPIILKG